VLGPRPQQQRRANLLLALCCREICSALLPPARIKGGGERERLCHTGEGEMRCIYTHADLCMCVCVYVSVCVRTSGSEAWVQAVYLCVYLCVYLPTCSRVNPMATSSSCFSISAPCPPSISTLAFAYQVTPPASLAASLPRSPPRAGTRSSSTLGREGVKGCVSLAGMLFTFASTFASNPSTLCILTFFPSSPPLPPPPPPPPPHSFVWRP
jgi:hypothetical protein